jgi:ribonuclease III
MTDNLYDLINYHTTNTSNDNISPYNLYNILITADDIKILFMKYDIEINVKNIEYYKIALTHKSYIKKEYYDNYYTIIEQRNNDTILDLQEYSNERLEFLGDTILKCIISGYLFQRYYYEDEGFMTRIKTKIENRETLALFARKLGIDKYMLISRQIEENNGRNSDKLLEDSFEAFIGALYIDQSFELTRKFIYILLECEIDYADILHKDKNYKDQLLRFFHQNKWSFPTYEVLSCDGLPHKRTFVVGVKDFKNDIIATGTANSKQKAEQNAAMHALKKLSSNNSK